MPLQIVRNDITKMKVDAIVNTTNPEMIGYSGVDLAIHTLAGPKLDEECSRIPSLCLGEAQITGGYDLPCKHVIHTAGPMWRGGHYGEVETLRSCYNECLKLAVKNKCRTVAFPLISAGVYQFPKDQVLKLAIQAITEFLLENELTVYLCVYDKSSYLFSQKLFDDIKSFIDDDYVDTHDENYYLESYHYNPVILSNEAQPKKRRDPSLDEFVKIKEKSFADKLFEFIDMKEMTDIECYKKANVDKKTFSKIKCHRKTYKPSKQTAVAFAIALHLDIDQTQELLATAGLTLSNSFTFDKIIRYFIQNGNYDIFEINEALFEFNEDTLGGGI